MNNNPISALFKFMFALLLLVVWFPISLIIDVSKKYK